MGNHRQLGCLTDDSHVQIHSCEPGLLCHDGLSKSNSVVWITPIITRSGTGAVCPEVGAGGGATDLYQPLEVELPDIISTKQLESLHRHLGDSSPGLRQLEFTLQSLQKAKDGNLSLEGLELDLKTDIPLDAFLKRLPTSAVPFRLHSEASGLRKTLCSNSASAYNTVYFPYARHSSYRELCDLVAAFRPMDIYPCTVDEDKWTEDRSMETLFGRFCNGDAFAHDNAMRSRRKHETMGKANLVIEKAVSPTFSPTLSTDKAGPSFRTTFSDAESIADLDEDYASDKTDMTRSSPPSDENKLAIRKIYDQCRAQAIFSTSGSSFGHDKPDAAASDMVDRDDMVSSSAPLLESFPFQSPDSGECLTDHVLLSESPKREAQTNETGVERRECDDFYQSTSGRIHHTQRRAFLQAYKAARLTLETSDSASWDDLGIRSIGNCGHGEPEEEL